VRAVLSADAEEFLSYLAVERGRAATSISAYRLDLAAYEAFLAGRGLAVADVTPSVVEDYLAFSKAAGLRPASIARSLSAIRGLHGFCADERGALTDPTADVEGPRAPRGIPKALSEDEIGRLLEAPVGDEPKALRDRAILECLYATGMRISEAAGLDRAALDFDAGLVRVFGKGSKERIVPIGGPAISALEAYFTGGYPRLAPERFARRTDAEAVFLSARGRRMSRQAIWTVVHQAAVTIDLEEKVTPHVLRHSFATHLLDHGADIRVVQELLGHASVATTEIYTKVSQEQLRRAFLAAHPRAAHARRASR
jgi:integrase/recombinase XerD